MRLALALGERHLGLTWPNPSVGARRRRRRRRGAADRRARRDPAGRPAARGAHRARGRRCCGARRDALCHARALLASRPDAALRRRDHDAGDRPRGDRARGPRSAGARARAPVPARPRRRGRHRRVWRTTRGGSIAATSLRVDRRAAGRDPEARRRPPTATPARLPGPRLLITGERCELPHVT